jgi:hypothetical protein
MTEEQKESVIDVSDKMDNNEISKIQTPEVSSVVEVVTEKKKKKATTDKQKEALARGREKLRLAQAARKANKQIQSDIKPEALVEEKTQTEEITTEEDVSDESEEIKQPVKERRKSVKKPVLTRTETEKVEAKSKVSSLSRVVDVMRQRLQPKFM